MLLNRPLYSQISVTTFRLGRFALAQQSHGRDSAIKIQGASFSSDECPVVSWEDFQVGRLSGRQARSVAASGY